MTVLVWHMPEWNDENQEGSQSDNVMAKNDLHISWMQV
jgi:hypothetical protein